MTNWYKIFYWLTVADNAKSFFITFMIIFSVSSAIALLVMLFNVPDTGNNAGLVKAGKRWFWRSIPLTVLFWGLFIFTPNKSDTLLIIAGGAVGNFITSDSSSKAIPSDITNFLHMKLQSEISGANDEVKRQLGAQSPKEKLIDKAKELSKEQLIEWLKSDTTTVK